MLRPTSNGKIIDLKKIFLIAVIFSLLASNFVFLIKYSSLQKELKETKQTVKTQQINDKVIKFTQLFIEKVLNAKEEISFEDRLKLENAVRDLQDENILSQWQKFTNSATESEAQENVRSLLDVLSKKISY